MRSRVFVENGIVHCAAADGDHDLTEAQATCERIQKLIEQNRAPGNVLVFLTKVAEVSSEARAVYTALIQADYTRRVAIVGASAFQRTIANLVIGVFMGTDKCKIFSQPEKALAWLGA